MYTYIEKVRCIILKSTGLIFKVLLVETKMDDLQLN